MSRKIPLLGVIIPICAFGVIASIAIELDLVKTLIPSTFWRFIIKTSSLLLAASPGIVSYARAEHRSRLASLSQASKQGIDELEDILVSAISILFDGEPSHRIRANVMIRSGQYLRMFCSANMKIFPDYQMSLRIGQGCAGAAWQRAVNGPISECWKPIYAPRAQLAPNQLRSIWNLTEEQVRLTKHVIWVLSIPIFRNDKGERKFLGVLNFDGVIADLKRPRRIMESGFIGSCVATGERISEHILTRCTPLLEQLDKGLKA